MTSTGSYVFNPDHPNGLSSPAATVVTAMTTAGVWFAEEGPIGGTDTDCVNILATAGVPRGF